VSHVISNLLLSQYVWVFCKHTNMNYTSILLEKMRGNIPGVPVGPIEEPWYVYKFVEQWSRDLG